MIRKKVTSPVPAQLVFLTFLTFLDPCKKGKKGKKGTRSGTGRVTFLEVAS